MRQSDCAARDEVDQIEIQSPCTVSWDAMRPAGGDGRVRFCGECRQNVYNVEAMSRGEAHRLIAMREGRVCVRILRRPDGTVVTADCWARLRAARQRGLLPFLGMLVLVGFTEFMAIGVGLARLRAMFAGPPPDSRISLPIVDQPPPPIMGAMPPMEPHYVTGEPPTPPEHTMGAPVPSHPKRHRLMGKMAAKPSMEKQEMLMGLLE
jgi:hypothetical protein